MIEIENAALETETESTIHACLEPDGAESSSLSPLGERARVRGNCSLESDAHTSINRQPETVTSPPYSSSETQDQQEFPALAGLIAASASPSRPRNGKIAALPPEVREQVNQMLRAGTSYADIAHRLGTWGHSGVSPANISNWKYGGFAEWLQQQQRIEAGLALPKALERSARSIDLDRLQHNAVLLACNQLSAILAKFDPERALDLLYRKPQLLPAFIGSLAALGRCTRDLTQSFELSHRRESAIHKQLEKTAATPAWNGHPENNGNGKPITPDRLELPEEQLKTTPPVLTNFR